MVRLTGPARQRAATAVVFANPVYATARALPNELSFDWNTRSLLYERGVLARELRDVVEKGRRYP